MFLTLSTSAAVPGTAPEVGLADASDLGYLLHKHPDRVQQFDLSVGRAHVFYPDAAPARCTVALLLEVDPIGIVRDKRFGGGDAFALAQYVNDRPYAASSMLAVALGQVFSTARAGRCQARPELPGQVARWEVHIPALPCRGGAPAARRFFEPLGWTVQADPVPFDPQVPEWGDSRYVDLRLSGQMRLSDALNQLYVLLPVLDDAKHYWVSADEVDKLVRASGEWIADHPARAEITTRYLAHQRRYVADAAARLIDAEPEIDEPGVDLAEPGAAADPVQNNPAPRIPLARQRAEAVLAASGASTVVDLGCGEGALLRLLATDRRYTRVLGADVSARALERAAARLNLREASDAQRERLQLLQSSLTYADERILGFDAAVLMEVIEHIDPSRHDALERAVWGHARPRVVVVTTPNAEYNVNYPHLIGDTGEPGSGVRHHDHRFEWTREQFQQWAGAVAARFGYSVEHAEVGEVAPDVGAPSQIAVFTRLSVPTKEARS